MSSDFKERSQKDAGEIQGKLRAICSRRVKKSHQIFSDFQTFVIHHQFTQKVVKFVKFVIYERTRKSSKKFVVYETISQKGRTGYAPPFWQQQVRAETCGLTFNFQNIFALYIKFIPTQERVRRLSRYLQINSKYL